MISLCENFSRNFPKKCLKCYFANLEKKYGQNSMLFFRLSYDIVQKNIRRSNDSKQKPEGK